mgnify:CR=1 FL=1
MKLRFLGTGTSTGVPQIGCKCKVCQSFNKKDKRLRASALLYTENTNLLIDCGPDFREQILCCDSPHLDALLITHSHYDHVGGVDDLRPYCKGRDFPIYCKSDVSEDLRNRVPYCFAKHPYPGVPSFYLNDINVGEIVNINDIEIEPLSIMHYKLEILGFKIGELAYITDAKTIPDETITKIKGLDTLIINALRTTEHISHMTLNDALNIIKIVKPRIAYLTHLGHDMGLHDEIEKNLPSNVKIAYDNLEIKIQ